MINALSNEGLLDDTTIARSSIDGGSIYWPQKRLFCYTIDADDDSDEIRELDGQCIVVRVLEDGETDTETCPTVRDACVVIRRMISQT